MNRALIAVGIVLSLSAMLLVGGWMLRRSKRSMWLRIPVLLLVTYGWFAVGFAWIQYLDFDVEVLGVAGGLSLILLCVRIAWTRYRQKRSLVQQSFLTKLSTEEFKRVTQGWEK